MTRSAKKIPLVDAILALLPGSGIRNVSQREWNSATFSGQQFSILLALPGKDAMLRAEILRDMLPDHEFHLNRHIVGDILIEDITQEDDHVLITIAALLLEE